MRQRELNRAVARATGETMNTVTSRGFSVMPLPAVMLDEREPLVVDWDDLEAERTGMLPPRFPLARGVA